MVLLIIVLWVAFIMVVEALSIACAGAVFLHVPLGDAWSMAWDRPGWLFLFALITSLGVQGSRN